MAAPTCLPFHILFPGHDIDVSPSTGTVYFPSLQMPLELQNGLDQQNVAGMMLHDLQGWVITENMASYQNLASAL